MLMFYTNVKVIIDIIESDFILFFLITSGEPVDM